MGKATLLQEDSQDRGMSREVYVPLKPDGVTNPQVRVHTPSPGVIIYRLEGSFIYPNLSLVNGALVEHVKAHTQRGKDSLRIGLGMTLAQVFMGPLQIKKSMN